MPHSSLVNKLKAQHYSRKERKRVLRLLRPSTKLRSVLRWRRSDRELRSKLQRRHSLLIESCRCRSISQPFQPTETWHFSFSGGGWLMVYMFGVCKALRELKVDENAKFIGTSAGCLSIVSLMLNSDFDEICDSVVNEYVPSAHATWMGPFKMRDYLIDAITRHGNINNMGKLHGKVTVVYTSLSAWVTRRVSHFKNPLHLLHTMVASCCATPLPLFEGVRTITVTPNVFAAANIKPSRYVPPWWSMYPPSQRDMQWLYDLGYEDGLAWCKRQGVLGSENIVIPTKAAEYDGEWRTVVGQVVGYRVIEDLVLSVADLLLLSEDSITCNFIRLELLLWKTVAIVAKVLDRMSIIWCLVASCLLTMLVLLDQHKTLEFVLVLGGHVVLAFVGIKNACSHVHSSEKWRLLQGAVIATENQPKVKKPGLTPQQHGLLVKYSYIYRMSNLLV
ncbi:Patatin-like phosphoLipase [Phytophthora megakarya]|uniref:Patatin-like phosphoLipase n=1 Tax=Phytophthora megakarya TaxID=4795 RepID=A0A225WMM6_9STRA|nr:Patatin-like phosphoLipase [Phytophthora megakarya]